MVFRVGAVVATTSIAALTYLLYGNRHHFYDLHIYYDALRWWAEGHPLYDYSRPDEVQGLLYFTYTPFAALVMYPIAFLPFAAVALIFTGLTVAATYIATAWLCRMVKDGWRGASPWYLAALVTPLLLLVEPLRETITLGQINLLLVLLILVDFAYCLPRGHRFAGIGIGLATAIKLFPGIFILYLLATRRWPAAVVAMAAASAATVLAGLVAPGTSWRFWTDALWSTERVGRLDYTGNQSLLGLWSRLVAPEPASRPLWLISALLVVFVGIRRAARAAAAGDELLGLTITGLVGGLVSPITWPHHIFWLLPALLVLVGRATAADTRVAPRALTLLAVAGVYAVAFYGVVSFTNRGDAVERTDSVPEFVLRNLLVLVALALVFLVPVRGRADVGGVDAGKEAGVRSLHRPA
ncbi:glycosyltransferase 87 family protein [Micromonospora sp. CPCC 205711]|uniref:glycosyltransferase 87 family protein n=1 Tax=Micromonospora sp. CPCC 205547 TaxID=3122400 RepID=UPI002FF20757